jgi:hypothetical protein
MDQENYRLCNDSDSGLHSETKLAVLTTMSNVSSICCGVDNQIMGEVCCGVICSYCGLYDAVAFEKGISADLFGGEL